MDETNINALYKQLWQEVQKHEGRMEKSTTEFVAALVKKLQAQGWQISQESEKLLSDYLGNIQSVVESAIKSSLTIVYSSQLFPLMQSADVLKMTEAAFVERWPDGLNLSQRLWKWEDGVKTSLFKILQENIKAGESVNTIIYDMQRAIETASVGERFKIVQNAEFNWVNRLANTGKSFIHDPAGKVLWDKYVAEAEAYIPTLAKNGTRSAAEQVLKQIKLAVSKGREDLVAKAVNWYVYDKQLYNLKRIARTEMATAAHRSIIAATENDTDIIGYQWRLSQSHKITDVCDYYANIDMGLGKGVWTKEALPRNKPHPHCQCLISPRITKIKTQGTTTYAEFIKDNPEILPEWAKVAVQKGTSIASVVTKDGLGLINKSEAIAKGIINA